MLAEERKRLSTAVSTAVAAERVRAEALLVIERDRSEKAITYERETAMAKEQFANVSLIEERHPNPNPN